MVGQTCLVRAELVTSSHPGNAGHTSRAHSAKEVSKVKCPHGPHLVTCPHLGPFHSSSDRHVAKRSLQ